MPEGTAVDIGKILSIPGIPGHIFLDVNKPALFQLPVPGQHAGYIPLEPVKKHIDAAYLDENILIIADSLDEKIHRWDIDIQKENHLSLSDHTTFSIPPDTTIVAIRKSGDRFILLDKNNCLLRVVDREFNPVKTIGSRLGYISEEEQAPRLGFEFPEDFIISGERIIVSDSGNKRLVVLNMEGKIQQAVSLPEYPFKFIFSHGDYIVASDFDRSLMLVSLEHGYVSTHEIDYPVDFYPSFNGCDYTIVGSESHNEVIRIPLPDISLEELAKEAGNSEVLIKILVKENRLPEAREMVSSNDELLPIYAALTVDETISDRLNCYVENVFSQVTGQTTSLTNGILLSAGEFIEKYKAIPDNEDSEAANIAKENVRHRMFLQLKEYRSQLRRVVRLKNIVREYPRASETLNRLSDERFQEVKQQIEEYKRQIEKTLAAFDELEMLDAIVHFWLCVEEIEVLFPRNGFKFEKLLGNKFLLEILNNFYYNIAVIFLLRQRVEQYIRFADREITLFPDKLGIFKQFVNKLILFRKYDDIMRMLKKFPSQDKENVNYYYYLVYNQKGEKEKAFNHLKREIDLYSHRTDLIPRLIQLEQFSPGESRAYIGRLLDKSKQSIDVNLHAAEAYFHIGDYASAEYYVGHELDLYPENKIAIRLKANLFHLTGTGKRDLEYYKNTWKYVSAFITINPDSSVVPLIIPVFSALNYIDADSSFIAELIALKERLNVQDYRRELDIFLAYVQNETEKYDRETYLSSYSTSLLAYNRYFKEVEQLAAAGEWESMFELVEGILKYNPGDEKIFSFLDRLEESNKKS